MSMPAFLRPASFRILAALSAAVACGDGSSGDGNGSDGTESGSTEGSGSSTETSSDDSSSTSTSSEESESGSSESESSSSEESSSEGASCAEECAGCCLGESCLEGDMALACGVDGAVCVECADHEACTANACAIDESKTWNLVVVSATVLNDFYDTGSPSSCGSYIVDPFVVAYLGMSAGETQVEQETTMPMWDDQVLSDTASAFLGDAVLLFVSDDDGNGACSEDDPIDNCAHQVTEADLIAGGFTLDYCGTNIQDLVLKLTPA